MNRSRRLKVALALNVVIVVAQVVAGLAAHSLGLLADAGHNLTDVAAVLLALIAVAWAARPPTANRSFGYHRATILAALANAGSILVVTVIIGYEAIRRFSSPESVHGGVVVIVGLIAFAVNAASAVVLRDGSDDLNMRAALVHMVGDAAASLGVVVAGLVILVTGGFEWLDPAVSLGIGLLIGVEAWRLVRHSVDVLLESTPRDLDPDALSRAMSDVDGVDGVHDLHVWSLSSEVRALSAHVVLDGHPTLEEAQVVGEQVKQAIAVPFLIAHATLELECETCAQDRSCIDASFALQTPDGHGHDH